MFGFLKKLFGGDAQTNKEAGVQIEQVPYKVEAPVVEDLADIAIAQRPAPTPEPTPAPAKKPAAKKPASKKPAGGKPRGRKPKTKA